VAKRRVAAVRVSLHAGSQHQRMGHLPRRSSILNRGETLFQLWLAATTEPTTSNFVVHRTTGLGLKPLHFATSLTDFMLYPANL
jgi:hypothetical protein